MGRNISVEPFLVMMWDAVEWIWPGSRLASVLLFMDAMSYILCVGSGGGLHCFSRGWRTEQVNTTDPWAAETIHHRRMTTEANTIPPTSTTSHHPSRKQKYNLSYAHNFDISLAYSVMQHFFSSLSVLCSLRVIVPPEVIGNFLSYAYIHLFQMVYS